MRENTVELHRRERKNTIDGTERHTLAIHLDHLVNGRGLDVVQDVVAGAGHEGAIAAYLYVALLFYERRTSQHF